MADTKKLLETKAKINAKRPEFIRQESLGVKRIKKHWRKPRGVHSKIRHKFKGKHKMPSCGYRSPRAVRHMNMQGLKQIVVHTVSDLADLKDTGVIIASSLGQKKKIEILKHAIKQNIPVLNIDAQKYVQDVEEKLKEKKKKKEELKQKQLKEKEAQEKESKKAAAKKKDDKKSESKDDNVQDQEQKEKKEKDKLLTKRV